MNLYLSYLTVSEGLLYGINSVIHMQAWSLAFRADRLQISYTEEKQPLSMCFTCFMWKSKALFKAERTIFSTSLYPELLQTRITKAKITTNAAEDHWTQEDLSTHSTAGLIHTLAWDVSLHLWNSMLHWWVSTRQWDLYSLCVYSMYHGCVTVYSAAEGDLL